MHFNRLIIVLAIRYALVSAFPNIIDQLTANGALTMVELIDQAGLTETLKTSGPYTILAPTESAFNKVSQQDLANLKGDVEALKTVLLYHVVNGELFSFDLKTGEHVNSLNGHVLHIRSSSGRYYFNEVTVIRTDVQASNGVIFLVDEVLSVPEGTIWQILNNPDYELTTFANITKLAQKDSRLNATVTSTRYTVFAPSNTAFSQLAPSDLNSIISSSIHDRYITDYHTHRGILHASDLSHDRTISTMHTGYHIRLTHDQSTGEPLLNEKSRIVVQDIPA